MSGFGVDEEVKSIFAPHQSFNDDDIPSKPSKRRRQGTDGDGS